MGSVKAPSWLTLQNGSLDEATELFVPNLLRQGRTRTSGR